MLIIITTQSNQVCRRINTVWSTLMIYIYKNKRNKGKRLVWNEYFSLVKSLGINSWQIHYHFSFFHSRVSQLYFCRHNVIESSQADCLLFNLDETQLLKHTRNDEGKNNIQQWEDEPWGEQTRFHIILTSHPWNHTHRPCVQVVWV